MKRLARRDFLHFHPVPTRWADNDVYGHVNNATYYQFFDTVINYHLIHCGGLHVTQSPVIGLAIETGCNFFASIAFPDEVIGGLRIAKLGRTSITYEIGLFVNEDKLNTVQNAPAQQGVPAATEAPSPLGPALSEPADQLCAAMGHFIHVFVDRETRRPVPIPDGIRRCCEPLLVKMGVGAGAATNDDIAKRSRSEQDSEQQTKPALPASTIKARL